MKINVLLDNDDDEIEDVPMNIRAMATTVVRPDDVYFHVLFDASGRYTGYDLTQYEYARLAGI